jgi:hypothetical protein
VSDAPRAFYSKVPTAIACPTSSELLSHPSRKALESDQYLFSQIFLAIR